jgi:hypothetical protein
MNKKAGMNLKEARKKGKLDQFIREHESDAPGDLDKLDKALKRPASRKTKEAPKASTPGESDD